MTTDAQALQIALQARPTTPRAALHLALMVGRSETHYGDAWPDDGTGAHGSNNWGSVHAESPPFFAHKDTHADGTPYITMFKQYATPEAGFADMANIVLHPNVLAAASSGDGKGAVNAMHANGYFELDPDKYASSVKRNYDAFRAATGEPELLTFDGVAPQNAPQDAPAGESSGDIGDLLWGLAAVAAAAVIGDLLAPSKSAGKGAQK